MMLRTPLGAATPPPQQAQQRWRLSRVHALAPIAVHKVSSDRAAPAALGSRQNAPATSLPARFGPIGTVI